MEERKVILAKFPHSDHKGTDDTKCYLYIKSDWTSGAVKLFIYESATNKCYNGQLAYDKIKETAEELALPYKTLLDECRMAMTDHYVDSGGAYDYKVHNAVFILSKIMPKCCIDLLEIALTEKNSHHDFLEAALERIEQLQKSIAKNSNDTDKISTAYAELLETHKTCLDELVEYKIELKKKFVNLINRKKQQFMVVRDNHLCMNCLKILKVDTGAKSDDVVCGGIDSIEVDSNDDENDDNNDEFVGSSNELSAPKMEQLCSYTKASGAMLAVMDEYAEVSISTTKYTKFGKTAEKRRLANKLYDLVRTNQLKFAKLRKNQVSKNTKRDTNNGNDSGDEDEFARKTQPLSATDIKEDFPLDAKAGEGVLAAQNEYDMAGPSTYVEKQK